MKKSRALLAGAAAIAVLSFLTAPALAQDYYGSVSAGAAWLDDSDNAGEFTSDFTTGEGTTIPAGTVLPAGSSLGWTTEFDDGYALSAAIGRRFGNWRGELELAYQSNDVDTHRDVQAAGIPLGAEDAGVLITGSPNLGVSVADLVAAGRGSVDTTFAMANLYYDFNAWSGFTPYVGGGIGAGFVNVDYSPSDVQIVDDDATVLAYQVIAGASYDVSDRIELFAQYRYRATEDVETEVSLFDADLDIENRASVLEAGMRFSF